MRPFLLCSASLLLVSLAAALPDITVIENREEQGLSGGRNTGIAIARGDVVAFLDDDAVADPDWLKFLADGLVMDAWWFDESHARQDAVRGLLTRVSADQDKRRRSYSAAISTPIPRATRSVC